MFHLMSSTLLLIATSMLYLSGVYYNLVNTVNIFLTFYTSEKCWKIDFEDSIWKSPINQKPIQEKLFFRLVTRLSFLKAKLHCKYLRYLNVCPKVNITAILFSINPLTNFYPRRIQFRAKIMRSSKLTFNNFTLQKKPIMTFKSLLI